MGDIKVSIIIAAYNVEDYIENCINSILKQTYQNFELIIVDDGSKDNTLDVCKKYMQRDHRVCVYHQTNKGVGEARNLGLKKASGDYITFIDSDDIICKKYLENLLIPCIKENADISICLYQYVNEGNNYNPIITNTYKVMDVDYKILQAKIIGRCCGTLIRATVVKGISFDTDLYVGEDLLFLCRCINRSNKIAITDDQLYCYYIYGESSYNGTYNDKKYTEIISWNRVIELFKDRPKVFRNTINRIYGWILLSNLLRMEEYHYCNQDKRKYCLKQLRKMLWPVFNRYPGGGTRSSAMYPIYIITCLSPRLGYQIFKNLMCFKHKLQEKMVQ